MAAKVKTFIFGTTTDGDDFIVTSRADIPENARRVKINMPSLLNRGKFVRIDAPDVMVLRDTRKDSATKRRKALLA